MVTHVYISSQVFFLKFSLVVYISVSIYIVILAWSNISENWLKSLLFLFSISWRLTPSRNPYHNTPFQEDTDYWRVPGLFWEKNLYFLVLDTAGTLIRFDTTTKRFHKIETSLEYDFTNKTYVATTTTVHRGSIHVCVKYDIGRTDVLNSISSITSCGSWMQMEISGVRW